MTFERWTLVGLSLVVGLQLGLWWTQIKINRHAQTLFEVLGKRTGLLKRD